MPVSLAVDLKSHEENDLVSSRLEKSIELVDAGEEGVVKSDHQLINCIIEIQD